MRVVKLRGGKFTLEHVLQHLKISCDASVVATPSANITQDVLSTASLIVRPQPNASAAVRKQIRDQTSASKINLKLSGDILRTFK